MNRLVAARTGTGEVLAIEQPMPEPAENRALIRVYASLISPGTEMAPVIAARKNPDPKAAPQSFGYANAGAIEEIRGDGGGLKPGMRVAAMGAGFAEHANWAWVPTHLVVPIPDSLNFERACYACLGATALQAVRRADPKLGENGLVVGLGIVGNLSAQLGRLSGGHVIGWETLPFRAKIASSCGVETVFDSSESGVVRRTKDRTAPDGVEFSILAFGGDGTKAFESVMSCMQVSADGHAMGRIVVVGGCAFSFRGGAASGNVDVRAASRTGPGYHDPAYEHGRDYPAGFVPFTTRRNLREIVRLLEEGRLRVDPLTTHRFALEDVGKAADALVEDPAHTLGVILRMREDGSERRRM